jgi:hypothetical protein
VNRRAALRRLSRHRRGDESWLPTDGGIGRRAWLKRAGAATLGVSAAVTTNNVAVGYGVVTGTNITEQSIGDIASDPFLESVRRVPIPGGRLRIDHAGERLVVYGEDGADGRRLALADTTPGQAREAAAAVGADPATVERAVTDVLALRAGEVRWKPVQFDAFRETVSKGEPRPAVTGLMRARYNDAAPETVADFTGVPATDPVATAHALAEGFRETTYYDIPRYLAGAIQFNVLMNTVELRPYLRSDTSFEALAEGRTRGMFCQELTHRSIEAFHAPNVYAQSPSVASVVAYDPRHRHNYTALASFTRRDGDLVAPIAFLDYTHSTLYDDLGLRGVLGEGLEAYNSRHRAKELTWWQDR